MNTQKLIELSDLGFKKDMVLGVLAARLLEAVSETPAKKHKIILEVADSLNQHEKSKSTTIIPKVVKSSKRKISIQKPDKSKIVKDKIPSKDSKKVVKKSVK